MSERGEQRKLPTYPLETLGRTGPIPGRPGQAIKGAPSPWIVTAAMAIGIVLGLLARVVAHWMGLR